MPVTRSKSLSGPSEQGRSAVVDCTPGTLEWEDVPGCEPRPGDLLRCLTKGVGSSIWVGEDSGFMERCGEHLAHKCIGTSSCKFSSPKFHQESTTAACAIENRQLNHSGVYQPNGRHPVRSVTGPDE